MFTKQALIAATLAFAGTAAMADDITIANDSFVATKSRAEVRAEVLKSPRVRVLAYNPAA
jgi:hypothetical protein